MHQNSRTRTLHFKIPSKPQGPHQGLSAPKLPTQQQRSVLTEQRGAPEAQHSHTGAGRGGGAAWEVLIVQGVGSDKSAGDGVPAVRHVRQRPSTTRRDEAGRTVASRRRCGQVGSGEGGSSDARAPWIRDEKSRIRVGCTPKTLSEGPKERFQHLSKS